MTDHIAPGPTPMSTLPNAAFSTHAGFFLTGELLARTAVSILSSQVCSLGQFPSTRGCNIDT